MKNGHPLPELLTVAILALLVSGCGQKELQGTLKINGNQVPSGNLILTPDIDQGNDGPTFYADVVDGKFKSVKDSRITFGPCKVVVNVPTRWLKKGITELNENEPITIVRATSNIPSSGSLELSLEYDVANISEQDERGY